MTKHHLPTAWEILKGRAWLPQTVPVLLGGDGLRYHVSAPPCLSRVVE
jgi:hypothetical protein